ncbi:MAG: glycosyltransferase family 4 protein, partial [Pseudomonadota bacterium]
DHIHAEFAGHPATAAWVISRATGLPYSVSCRAHDIFRTQRLLAQKLGEAAFVRTISEFGKRFLQERVPSVPASRYQVIHSSVDPASIPALDPPATDPFHIVYVGSLEAKKGVGILLRALKDLPFDKWHCSIGGGGPDRTGLEVQTNELGLSDKVRFLGPLDIAGVMDLYAGASVVVAPSIIGPGGRAEGIPNVMIEALACQRPAISTAISGIPELIETGRTGLLVEPGSPEQLAEAITQIHGDPAKAFEMAAAGRAKVEAEFSLPVNTRRQLDLFAQHSANRPAEAA